MADRTVRVRLEAAVQGFVAGTHQAAAASKQLSTRVGNHARDNAQSYQQVGIAAAGIGVAAAAGMRSVLSAGADFQTGMNQVKAVSGATGEQMEALSDQARELGASTKFSATEAAEGMGFLAMAGFETNETMSAMPGVLELAAAGTMDLASAADIASNVLTGYGFEAGEISRVNDVMAATFSSTNTDLRQLGEAMKFVAPVASAAGLQFEEVSAALGLLGKGGMQGSMGGTVLRGAITKLLNPSKKAAGILEELGINAVTADGKLVGLDSIIEQLASSGATAGEMMEIFGQRAGPGMANLVAQGADALRDQTTVSLESAGTAAEIAETQMEGLGGALIEMKSAAEGMKIALFESGAGDVAEGAVDSITGVFRALEAAPQAVQTGVMGLGGVTAAVGTLGGGFLMLAPRVVQTRDALREMGPVANRAARGMGMLGRSLGIAAAAFAAQQAIAGLHRQIRDMQKGDIGTIDEMSLALEGLAKTGGVPDSVTGSFNNLGDAIQYARIQAAGGGKATFIELSRSLGVADIDRAGDAFENLDAALAQAVQSGNSEQVAAGLQLIADEMGISVEAAGRMAGEVFPEYAKALDAADLAQDEVAGSVGVMGDEFEEVEEEIVTATEALGDWADAQRATSDPVFKARQALDKLSEAQEDLHELVHEGKQGTDEYSEALVAEWQAADEAEFALRGLTAAHEDGMTSYEQIDARANDLVESMGLSGEAADNARELFVDLFQEAAKLPTSHHIDITASDSASGIVANLQEQLGRLPSRKEIEIRARTGAGTGSSSGSSSSGSEGFGPGERDPRRAKGGPVRAGFGYLVGEQGQEWFEPETDGYVHNATRTRSMLAEPATTSRTSSVGGFRQSRQPMVIHVEMDGREVVRAEGFQDEFGRWRDSYHLNSAT